jgi:exopolyphosphatase/guanosine-5'-triphosphate,3'-diphosphate pyrophosphatase
LRVAVVDIGTNSTRLLVAEVDERGRLTELDRGTKVTRLGQGVDGTGALAPEAMERVYATLDDYRATIDAHGAQTTVAVLTSAVRDASNGPEFTAAVRDRYGLDARTIPGEEEARLSFLGATSERSDADDDGPVVVIDIGGGSTELVVGTGREVTFFVSTQAGVVRHSERHITSDPPRPDELEAVASDVRRIFEESVPADLRAATTRAISVAGTATSLASIDQKLDPYDPAKVHGYRLSISAIQALLEQLAGMPEEERRRVPGLDPNRAPTVVAGAVLLREAVKSFSLKETEVSEHDILHGAALEAVHRAR